MKRATWLSSLLFVSLLAMVVVPAVLAGANSQITLKPSNSYPKATGTAQPMAASFDQLRRSRPNGR